MKKIKKYLFFFVALLLLPVCVYALNVTVPVAPSSGYILTSTSTGSYVYSASTSLPYLSNLLGGLNGIFGNTTTTRATATSLSIGSSLIVGTGTVFADVTSNRVGVGTSSPSTLLHLSGNTPMLRIQNTAPSGKTFELFAGTAGSGIGTPTISSQFIINSDAISSSLLIDSTRVVFGTSQGIIASAGNDLLLKSDINGTVNKAVTLQGWNGSVWQGALTVPNKTSGNVNVLMANNGGNVGIGTSSPTAKFSIYGNSGVADIFAISSSSNTRLLTVTAKGNVGIGTTTPENNLEVVGTTSTTNLKLNASAYSGQIVCYLFDGSLGHISVANILLGSTTCLAN